MNIFGKLAVSGLVLSVASMASAASVSGSTDFRVTLPEILVLYHWDDAHLILQDIATTSGNDSDAGREISDVTSRTLTDTLGKSPYEIVGTGAVNTDVPTNALNKVNVTLKNSWAVRSLSSGDVTLALTNPNAVLTNVGGTSTITTSKATLVGGAGTDGISKSIPSGWAAVTGDINFDLDLTTANAPGEYNTWGTAGAAPDANNATDVFLLTLTGN